MQVRKAALVLAFSTLAVPAAFAGSVFVGGEQGFIDTPTQSSATRRSVLQELGASRSSVVDTSGARFVGGEQGYVLVQQPSLKTREEVVREFDQFKRNPVGADGGVFVGGEAGYVLPQQAATFPRTPVRPSKSAARS